MKRFGRELKFISRIDGDGKKIILLDKEDMSNWDRETFKLNCLSITNNTWIASAFSSFVVKLKGDK